MMTLLKGNEKTRTFISFNFCYREFQSGVNALYVMFYAFKDVSAVYYKTIYIHFPLLVVLSQVSLLNLHDLF